MTIFVVAFGVFLYFITSNNVMAQRNRGQGVSAS